jgi:hypothetical protein
MLLLQKLKRRPIFLLSHQQENKNKRLVQQLAKKAFCLFFQFEKTVICPCKIEDPKEVFVKEKNN